MGRFNRGNAIWREVGKGILGGRDQHGLPGVFGELPSCVLAKTPARTR